MSGTHRDLVVRRSLRVLAWVAGIVGGLIVVLLIAVALIDWNAFKGPLERFASTSSGRTVSIAGRLEVHPWSWRPRVAVEGLTVGNPAWEKGAPPLLQVERAELQLQLSSLLKGNIILPRVALIHPQVYLHRDPQGRANWTFENKKPRMRPPAARRDCLRCAIS